MSAGSPTPCDRWEREGLVALVHGHALDAHFDECEACRRARADYERLAGALAAPPTEPSGAPDWQARVFARLARERAGRRRLQMLAFAAGAAAVVVVLWVVLGRPSTGEPSGASIAWRVEAGALAMRGAQVRPGDVVVVEGHRGAETHVALRIYGPDDRIVAECGSPGPACAGADSTPSLRVRMPAPGRYRPAMLTAPRALPAAQALDQDATSARESGGRLDLAPVIDVY